jgi:GTP-binding protein HflX
MTDSKSRQPRDAGERQGREHADEAAAGDVTRAVVIHPFQRSGDAGRAETPVAAKAIVPPEARLDEAVGLARAIALDVVERGLVPLSRPRPATLIGSGKVEELSGVIRAH